MRLTVFICLVFVLFVAHAEARPSEETRAKLRESGQKLWTAVVAAARKCAERVRQRIEEYLEKDNLGEKIAEVVKILSERLTKRIETYVGE
ncbi:hypothetical protein CSKR_200262 [Clonorchis sinensis]|uniref:Uncharacterized protein n=1 Tax=Clonorchis sinensis TaxID=79923 RepID=Q8MXC3_CLOSI|nr:unknown [Clonorchis sinensis]KAG5442397.1 hypothetical protein CSKR_200262 [Clonorchis sinensis]